MSFHRSMAPPDRQTRNKTRFTLDKTKSRVVLSCHVTKLYLLYFLPLPRERACGKGLCGISRLTKIFVKKNFELRFSMASHHHYHHYHYYHHHHHHHHHYHHHHNHR